MSRKKKKAEIEGLTTLVVDDAVYHTQLNKTYSKRKPYEPHNPRKITSFMPGTIQEVYVKDGDEVSAGSQLCILEAMKMKNIIAAPFDGVIKTVNVKTGELVPKNHVLIELA
jgi:pyruvate carboxylase